MLITELMVLSAKAEGHYKKGILIGEGGSRSSYRPERCQTASREHWKGARCGVECSGER